MKVVQTLWLKKTSGNSLAISGGWLSPEYHWMSWALSCLQLNKLYGNVELYANEAARELLIDKLQLPYCAVHKIPDSFDIPENAWALSKIYTYSQQNEPFLHVDGDVYIWEPFEDSLLGGDLIAQNLEVNFLFYKYCIDFIQEECGYLPDVFLERITLPILSSNAGILGGKNICFFKEYAKEAIRFVNANKHLLNNIKSSILCMTFEQLLFFCLAREKNIEIKYLYSNPIFDSTYPGFGSFDEVPYFQKFVHAMGEYKRKKDTCIHLAKQLRKDYPLYYYRVLKTCLESDIALDNQSYSYHELSPLLHNALYYRRLREKYLMNELDKTSWLYCYAKDVVLYEHVEGIYSLEEDNLLNQVLILDSDCRIVETFEPELVQTLRVKDVHTLATKEIVLDGLSMILLDSFIEPKPIKTAIREVAIYFEKEEIEGDFKKFQDLLVSKIKELLFLGALQWNKYSLPVV